jgi:hypothetical protein
MEGSNVWWSLKGFNVWWFLKGYNVWWPLKGSNVWWPLKGEGETSFSPHLIFPPKIFYLNLFFPIDLKVLLYHGFRLLLYVIPSFSLTYKLQPHILMYQIFFTFILKLILIEDFFFLSLNSWLHA